MKRSTTGQPKRQGGISLIPALWDAIDDAAKLAGVPRNRVMERILMEKFGLSTDYRKAATNSRETAHSTDGAEIRELADA